MKVKNAIRIKINVRVDRLAMDYVNLNTGALITFPDVLPSYWGYGHVMEAANPHEADCTGETEVWA